MNKRRSFRRWYVPLSGLVLFVIGVAVVYRATDDHLYALGPGQPSADVVRFAVIGDFGVNSPAEADVAARVKSWTPDLILTVGDNNYPDGTAATIDINIGQYYHEYIFPYLGAYGPGASENRFFPALGNHDWHTITCVNDACSGAYFDYFTLPGNERYYDFVQGPVHFFVIDSDSSEPDGRAADSIQGAWLQARLAASTAQWKVVFMHHAPYSSSTKHGSHPKLQWPYAAWGAHAVFAGHDHLYERIIQDGIPYFVNGAGGAGLYTCGTAIPGSQLCYDSEHGAMLVVADNAGITFQFITRSGQLIDSYMLGVNQQPTPTATATLTTTVIPTMTATPTATPTATATPAPGEEVPISQSSDDGEEHASNGALLLDSSDLELVDDAARGSQVVGLRFQHVPVPQGVTITHAYIEFTVDEVNAEVTSLLLHGQAVDHAPTFISTTFDISLRPQTVISVAWDTIPGWNLPGAKVRTPNLASIVQEIVNRPGWVSGNALAFVITGTGHRTAEAYDKGAAGAPRLRVEYPGAPTPTPTFTATTGARRTLTPTSTPTGQGVWLPYVGQ